MNLNLIFLFFCVIFESSFQRRNLKLIVLLLMVSKWFKITNELQEASMKADDDAQEV